jgi:hypothetical protein
MLPLLDRTVSLPVATSFKVQGDGRVIVSDTAGTLYDSAVPSVQILLSRTAALAWRLIFRFTGLAANVKYRATRAAYRY